MVIIIACVILINNINNKYSNNIENKEKLPYKKNNYILSMTEKNFHQVLITALKDTDYFIFIKIRFADVISAKDNKKKYINLIKTKNIDFLICNNNKYFNPILAIELDDKSYNSIDKIVEDKFIEKVFKSAKLPFLRANINYPYSTNELRNDIYKLIKN